MDSETITGLKVHLVSMDEALGTIAEWVKDRQRQRHIVTADASMAVIARRDPELSDIIREADMVTPDGAGIIWASRLLRRKIVSKVSGVDLVGQLCCMSAHSGCRIFFLGAAPGVAAEAAEKLRAKYPGAQIVGTQDGYFSAKDEPGVVNTIRELAPDILLVAFGIPKQEKWIKRYKGEIGVPVSVGIGGSFDVFSGRVSRAPVWMQKRGLEWLYRLAKNPKKISKVMTLPQFAILTVLTKLKMLPN